MGQVGEGRVLVEDHSLWRALLAAGAERICCALPCRAESSREVQRPVVPSGHGNASLGACVCFGVGSRRRSAPQVSDLIDTEGVTRARLFTREALLVKNSSSVISKLS